MKLQKSTIPSPPPYKPLPPPELTTEHHMIKWKMVTDFWYTLYFFPNSTKNKRNKCVEAWRYFCHFVEKTNVFFINNVFVTFIFSKAKQNVWQIKLIEIILFQYLFVERRFFTCFGNLKKQTQRTNSEDDIKTQRKVVSDFAEKKATNFPLWSFFFFRQKYFFFGFSEKISKCFFNEIDCKKFSKIFHSQFHWKKFRKFLIVNFKLLKKNLKFFYCWIHCKNISKIFTVNFIEKKFRNFFRKSEKKNFA